MNYLEEQTDGEAMINCIKNADQEKKIQKIDRLVRSLLIQRLPSDIYSLTDSNKTAKDLWDALARHMLGSEYGEQDRKAEVLYEYEMFKATEGELLLNTYIRYLQVINDLKKCGDVTDAMGLEKKNCCGTSDSLALIVEKTKVSKSKEKVVVSSDSEGSDADDFSELKKINALKFYSKPTNNNLRTSSTSQSANKKQEFVKTDDKKVEKKDDEKKRDMSKVKCYICKKEGHFAKDCKKVKVKDYEYYKKKMLLEKKDKDEQITFSDDYFQEIINPNFEKIDSPFQQTSSLKSYVLTVILEKIIIDLEDEVVRLLEKEKENLKIIESLKSNDVETGVQSSEKVVSETENKSENDCQDIEKVCDKKENPNEIAPGMYKLSVSKSVSPIYVTKTSCASNGVENLDTLSSARRPKSNGVKWMRKGSSNTVKADLSSVNHSNLNKNVKRYSHTNLMAGNNFDTRSAFDCNNARNALCNARMNASVDVNDFLFLMITVHRWLPKFRSLAEPVAKWIPKIVQIYLWIINSRCSKHMTGNRALLTNFMEKFFGTVYFGNNDFAVIVGYEDVVIGSMIIKKVYYVKGLGHNLFSVGQFCDNGLEVAFRKSTCFVRNEDGVDLLTGDCSLNLYTISLNEVASNSSTCLLEKASSSQSWLWHQHHLCSTYEQGKIHLKYHKSKMAFASNKLLYLLHMDLCGSMRVESINGKRYVLVVVDDYLRTPQQNGIVERRNQTLVDATRTMIKFANLPSFLWAEAIAIGCFTQNHLIIHKRFDKTPYELMNKRKPNIKFFRVFGCRCYLLNDYEDVGKLKAKRDIGVFVGYSKNLLHSEFTTNELIRKSSTMNVDTSNVEIPSHEKEVFHESSESFQEESSSSSLNDDVQQSSEEVIVSSSNTQSISNNMVPNIDKASTSHNVFNDRLEDAYFDGSTSFHDPDPKSSVRTRGQLANSCLFSCLLSSIDPANVAEALRAAEWVSAMQEELDQFARLKDYAIFQMDVKTTFLNGILKEEVYVGQPLVPTPMVEQAKLKLDLVGKPGDHIDYRSMIGSLMYVTSSRPGTINLGLWYPKDYGFDLTAYSDADHAGCHLDRKAESEYVTVSSCCAQVLWMCAQLTDYGFFMTKYRFIVIQRVQLQSPAIRYSTLVQSTLM
nr:hypothetical protein [Tanacetum cinerariifolium]